MRPWNAMLLAIGSIGMIVALSCQDVTLASQDGRGILLLAAGCVAIGETCCAVVFHRGGSAKWVALIIARPSP